MVGQVARRSLEAADLVVLRKQIADRVLDQVDQPVGAPGRDARHVTQGDLDGIPIRLLAHSGNHVRDNLMPVHVLAGSHQWERDPAGAFAGGGGGWSGDWLARKDSNLQSPDPESGALPFGHSPPGRSL
jgi:hypothetical protein